MNENFPRIPVERVGKAGWAVIARRLSAILVLTALCACATQRNPGESELSDRGELSTYPEWSFSGSIGVRAGTEGFNGRIRWHQVENGFSATISGPLGAGTIAFNGDGERITIIDKNGDETELTNAESDLREMYGWTIPVSSLRYWALGVPDPAIPATIQIDDDGQLSHIEQRNWAVRISEYSEGSGQLVPRRIVAVNADVKVTLFIRRWTFF